MRTLIDEQSYVITVPASTAPQPTYTLGSATIRPRLEGYRTALRGDAFSAKYVDSARVLYTVTPSTVGGPASLAALGAALTVTQVPLLSAGLPSGFTPPATNVTGAFLLSGGVLAVDLQVNGVCRTSLALTNLSSVTALQFLVQVQIFGDQRAIDIENVDSVDNPALPNGLALAVLLDG